MTSRESPSDLTAALAQFRAGRIRDARTLLNDILRRPAPPPDALALAGLVASDLGDFEAARAWHAQSIERAPAEPLYCCNLGRALQALNDLAGASTAYGRALELDRGFYDAIVGQAAVFERQGRYADVRALLDRLPLPARSGDRAALVDARLHLHAGDARSAVEIADRGLAHERTSKTTRRSLHFVRGQALDRLDRIDDAFAAFECGNAINALAFDPETMRRKLDAIRECFAADVFRRLPSSACTEHAPIFIVGAPRSGTTLLEHILSAHPDVAAAGERQDLALILQVMPSVVGDGRPYPYCLDALTPTSLEHLAAAYVQRVRRDLGATTERIVDKTIANFERIGIIRKLFPAAHLVHVQRDPRDQGLSCYMQDLVPRLHPWSTDLADIGHYRSEHGAMMAHWRSLGIRLIEVRYEALVTDPRTEGRRLFERLGLEFDASFLDTGANRRNVATASYHQVSKPIAGEAVGRHARYADHLLPLNRGLGAVAGEPLAPAATPL